MCMMAPPLTGRPLALLAVFGCVLLVWWLASRWTRRSVVKAAQPWVLFAVVSPVTMLAVALAFPMLDPCDICLKVWPEWVCILRGCF